MADRALARRRPARAPGAAPAPLEERVVAPVRVVLRPAGAPDPARRARLVAIVAEILGRPDRR